MGCSCELQSPRGSKHEEELFLEPSVVELQVLQLSRVMRR